MTTLYLCLIFGIYPLVIQDGLFALQKTKLTFFAFVSLIYIIYSFFHIKEWRFRKLDGYVLAFFGSLCLSTFFSKSFINSLVGHYGRYYGLLLMGIYLLLYFCLSRSTYQKDVVEKSMVFGVCISASLGFLNVLGIDPLQIYPRMLPEQRQFFISTLGNLDFYGAYQALVLGYFLSLKWSRLTIIGVIFSSIGLASSNVDAALIALVVYSLFVLFQAVKKDFMLLLSLMIATLFLSLQILLNKGTLFTYSYLYQLLGNGFICGGLIFGLWVLYLLPQKMIKISIIFVFISVLALILYFTLIYDDGSLPQYLEIFRLNESWGSYRGALYQLAIDHYQQFNWSEKLFGYGLETVSILTANQMIMGGVYVDAYHSVYLQLLVTSGVLGLTTYIGMLYAFMKEYRCLIWIIFIVLDIVSIWQVASTPFAFIFLFMLKKT